ncbi:5' exonuclease Apollo [Callorhinchus milii]|uniref:5' exonuclease Apollo n=1 Tax=Callorhinchus milii TaxID=7868 RepID=A0A4W3JPV2_CALMI|nr:5' exonuclease Apollo [Callorhinchus milii]XP_007892306.1 5' exonuclease Apollo [Callorhinchus milii]|eukprot:gi/632953234/ref/XP_007892305.1/ PREDICTED: 5' exonuclease Apollo isoform X2 [Callorhinchus milii]
MNGTVIPFTPIAVDFWQIRKCSNIRLFFLSHMHTDHTSGLSSTWKKPIYCSPVTAKLLRWKLQVDEMWIHPLELDESHLLNLDEAGRETMTVTLMDANHCPGSAMFLFQGYFGTILYTADFRYTPVMFEQPPLNREQRIDILYLDNTNCDPEVTVLARQDAAEQIKGIIGSYPEHDIVIGLYCLGKESLLTELALAFKTWIVVSPQRLEMFQLLGLPNVFTSEEGAGRIRVVEQSKINSYNMIRWNREHPTKAILPTSRKHKVFHPDIHVVCYSDHSSFEELQEFVSRLRPCSLIPVVRGMGCESYFRHHLSPRDESQRFKVPESVERFMQQDTGCQQVPLRQVNSRLRSLNISRGVVFDSPDSKKAPEEGRPDCNGASNPSESENSLESCDDIMAEDFSPQSMSKANTVDSALNFLKRKFRIPLAMFERAEAPSPVKVMPIHVKARQASLLDVWGGEECTRPAVSSSSLPSGIHLDLASNANTSRSSNGNLSSSSSDVQDSLERASSSSSSAHVKRTRKRKHSMTNGMAVSARCCASLQAFDAIVEQYFKKRHKACISHYYD